MQDNTKKTDEILEDLEATDAEQVVGGLKADNHTSKIDIRSTHIDRPANRVDIGHLDPPVADNS